MREGPHPVVESLWHARPRELARRALSDMVDDEILKIRSVWALKEDPELESKIATFKEDFASPPRAAEPLKPEDTQTHLELAIAYREMGLTEDAIEEAAMALTGAAQLGPRAHLAAEIVLNPGSLRTSLEETLATLRVALFPG
jgi:hypothetical protein